MRLPSLTVIFALLMLAISIPWAKGEEQGIFAISFNGSRVSIHAESVPLRQILVRLSENLTVDIYYTASLSEIPVSVSFDNLPLERALPRIFRDFNFLARFKNTDDADRLSSLKIYPKGTYSGDLIPIDSSARVVEVGEGSPPSGKEVRTGETKVKPKEAGLLRPASSDIPATPDTTLETGSAGLEGAVSQDDDAPVLDGADNANDYRKRRSRQNTLLRQQQ